MPIYEYICSETGESFEVIHGKDEFLSSWQELCERLNQPLGSIAPDSPVTKKFGGKLTVLGNGSSNPSFSSCASEQAGISPAACCGGVCKR